MSVQNTREFLGADIWATLDARTTDQGKGEPMPPIEKPIPEGARTIPLQSAMMSASQTHLNLHELIGSRNSCRRYADQALALTELSFLLWATQGVRGSRTATRTWRNVPSGGNRHPLETYLGVLNVEELTPGIYRYLPLEHALLPVSEPQHLPRLISEAAGGQGFVGQSAVVFLWTAVPYRTVWRYAGASPKLIAIDAGHVCQNLYLAAQAIGCGTCAVAAYDQIKADRLVDVDGKDEFTVYLAPVGKRV